MGVVLMFDDWCELFVLFDCYGFVIVFDECYLEIYFDEVVLLFGGFEVVYCFGCGFEWFVMLLSLLKCLNVLGMCLGFVVGDVVLLK